LPDKDRRIVKLRYQPGATNRTVAEEVGKSDSAISRSLNRIYGLLLNCIQAQVSPRSAGGGR
jgi:DNA-directed RNA polymerase specialized sigma subunit